MSRYGLVVAGRRRAASRDKAVLYILYMGVHAFGPMMACQASHLSCMASTLMAIIERDHRSKNACQWSVRKISLNYTFSSFSSSQFDY